MTSTITPQRTWTASTRWIAINSSVIVLVVLVGFVVQAIPGWTDAEFSFLVDVTSLGDLLSQPVKDGGLGLGTTLTSVVFLLVIVVLVTAMSMKLGRERRALEQERVELVAV